MTNPKTNLVLWIVIFVTPEAGANFIVHDTVEFAFSHEIAHLISKKVGVSKAKGLLKFF